MLSSNTRFKPGQSGNSFGRPKLSNEQKLFKALAKDNLVKAFVRYGSCSYSQLRKLKKEELSVGEDILISYFLKAEHSLKLKLFIAKQLLQYINLR